MSFSRRVLLLGLGLAVLASCGREPDLVVYVAHDQAHSEPILREFERRTGLRVHAEFDVEAHKTVGLVKRIEEEARRRTRCDVFWNNEFAHSVSLAEKGLLAPYDSPSAAGIPEEFRDAERRWTGFAARARCYIVNTDLVDPAELTSSFDLVDPRWEGRTALARPLSGTTLTHITALYTVWGEEETLRHLQAIRDTGVALPPGNGPLARLVGEGQLSFGWTDTDDYNVRRLAGDPVDIVFPDCIEADGEEPLGVLFIPNTVMLLKDAPNPDAAKQLIDYLLSPEVERKLADSRAAQIPLHASLADYEHVLPLERMKPMRVDYTAIGRQIDQRTSEIRELFLD